MTWRDGSTTTTWETAEKAEFVWGLGQCSRSHCPLYSPQAGGLASPLVQTAADQQGNCALSGSNWAAVRHCLNRRDHEWLSLGSGGQNFICQPFPLISAHFQPLPPIFAIWCPDRLAVSGDLKIGTAFNTAIRLEIRHEAWQEPSVIKTRLPCADRPAARRLLALLYPRHRRLGQMPRDKPLHQLNGPLGLNSGKVAEAVRHPREQLQLYVASSGAVGGLELVRNELGNVGVIGALDDYGGRQLHLLPAFQGLLGVSLAEAFGVGKVGLRGAYEPVVADFAGPKVSGAGSSTGQQHSMNRSDASTFSPPGSGSEA